MGKEKTSFLGTKCLGKMVINTNTVKTTKTSLSAFLAAVFVVHGIR